MTKLDASSLSWLVGVASFTVACGGTVPEPESSHGGTSRTESESEPAEPASVEPVAEPAAAEDPCSWGGCNACGDVVCLTGFYCDQAAAACAWLPQCEETPGCKCLLEALGANCTCEERAGAAFVDCR
jgi:hypothetical protein